MHNEAAEENAEFDVQDDEAQEEDAQNDLFLFNPLRSHLPSASSSSNPDFQLKQVCISSFKGL
jgi:hypothetical protein